MMKAAFRKILHLDMDAFFCAVEELKDPSLAGKAFAVGGKSSQRGVISTCSYEARKYGVHSAMPTAQAFKACPQLLLISGFHHDYSEKSAEVMQQLHQLTGLVEQVSVDEAFLDVTDLSQSLEQIAKDLQKEVFQKTGLPCSLGGATNKMVAKIANDFGKSESKSGGYPRAITIVPHGKETAFLSPLPVKAMWGVGPKMERELVNAGMVTIGDIALRSKAALENMFGKYGFDLYDHALGLDDRPVTQNRVIKSVSQETTFAKDINDPIMIRQTLRQLSSNVAYQLRQDGFCARVVRLKIRWPDFSTHTRQLSLQQPTDQDGVIYSKAEALLNSIWETGKSVRLIGVGASDLVETAHQMTLWETPTEKERRLLNALDDLRDKYGKGAVKSGNKIIR